ncbi:MAG: hypothetical protein J6B81_03540 [Spirochaetaceae bacterium]|nr:hypothetical protein [Spirochaetaceae bacterium]
MTLNIRNKLLLAIFIVAIAFILATTAVIIISVINSSMVEVQNVSRLFNLPNSVPLLAYNFWASFLSAVVLIVYSAVVVCFLYINFEKTQAPEVVYFVVFLVGAMLEGGRLWLPAYNVWASYSVLYIAIGRLLFFGRTMAALSLVFLVLLSCSQNANQEADRNSLLIVGVAAVFALIIPVDTMTVPSNCAVRFGYEKIFTGLCLLCFVLAFIAMKLNAKSFASSEYSLAATGYIMLVVGYIILTQTDSFFMLIAGNVLLIPGTILMLSNLHRYYMWK